MTALEKATRLVNQSIRQKVVLVLYYPDQSCTGRGLWQNRRFLG